MIAKLLCVDVLAIRYVNNFIFVAIGSTLHIFDAVTYKLEKKLDCLYPHNIHGIIKGPRNKLAVFGANFFSIYVIYRNEESVIVEEVMNKKCLDDWIIAAKWFTFDGHDHLAAVLAHNNVCLYNTLDNHRRNVDCEKRCIIYAGSVLVDNSERLIIFSGTVFQEILIWEVNYASLCTTNSSILHRLEGHNGVIFSVIYDPITKFICSTSDDRTVRLWAVNGNENEGGDGMNWRQADIKLLRTMFGHTARVWRSIIGNGILITIGEDSLLCVWSLEGKLLNKIYAHRGAPIWSIDISEDNKTALTGGADGAVQIWNLTNNHVQRTALLSKKHNCTLPKYVCHLSGGKFLVFDEGGRLFLFDRLYDDPIESIYLEKFSSYCIMTASLCRSYVSFASKDGYVAIYKEINDANSGKLECILENKIMESQIYSVQWLENNQLLACGSNGILRMFNFTMEGSTMIQSTFLLPPSRERWLTSATLHEELLICGDRAGNMHVFNLKRSASQNNENATETKISPVQTFAKVHGKIGVQSFLVLDSKLISCGRDGVLRFYETNEYENKKSLRTLHNEKMPMDWITGSLKTPNDTLILGFKEVEFVIYSMFYQRTVARIPCGGGHRSWDCVLLNESVSFLYIRNKQVFVFDSLLSSMQSPILLNGFHAKETHCAIPLSISDRNIFVSGGEDGTVRVTSVANEAENVSFRTLGIFDGHTSSVKSVASLSLGSEFDNKRLVFSGGGKAQLKVWEIVARSSGSLARDADVSCYDIASHMLYGIDRSRRRQMHVESYVAQPETRYMDIEIYHRAGSLHCAVFVACADGFVRIFSYDLDKREILLKASVKCGDRCITKISVVGFGERVIALIMSTDGIARFIDFTDVVLEMCVTQREVHEFRNRVDTVGEAKLHQSGINSYDVKAIKKGEYLLATGGDDNLFNLLRFKIYEEVNGENVRVSILSRWNTSTVHYAQITGIKFHGADMIFSVGIDQQIVVYNYDCSDELLSARVTQKMFTFVTDAKGVTLWQTFKGETVLCIYGRGFELLFC